VKFIKKPKIIEAEQLTWANWGQVCDLIQDSNCIGVYLDENGNEVKDASGKLGLKIPTLAGTMLAKETDWIIRGLKGELYPCRNDIFLESYDPVP
jgi:hypothetical protein